MDMQTLPSQTDSRQVPLSLDWIPALKVPGLRVVIIEDSKIILDRLEESLAVIRNVEIVGHADNEPDALLLLRNARWNVALVDMQLKTGTGIGVLKALGESAADDRHRIIVFTNYAYPQYEARCRALGAAHFFDKSRHWNSLLGLITKLAAGDNAV
ncbi:MAG: response regulator [Betaproteobacteria bacterium]